MTMKSGSGRLCAWLFAALFAGTTAAAYEPGEVAYLCDKNQKFMWVVGEDSWTACPVRILARAGNSHKVLAHQGSCYTRALSISRGQEAWTEGYNLWPSRSACEDQGKSKPKVTAKAPAPAKPKPIAPAPKTPEASLAVNVPVVENMRKAKEQLKKDNNGFGLMALTIAEAANKENKDAITILNNCKTPIKVTVDLIDTSGKAVQSRWTLDASGKPIALSQGGKAKVKPAKNAILLHAVTTSGRHVYAGNAKTLKFGAETAYLKEFRIRERPYYIKFCP